MAGIDGHALWRLADVLKSAMPAPKQTDRATARLSYVDDEGIGWYRIDGSSIDTPCVGGEVADVQPGEQVEVEIRGGMLYVTGNDDSPSVGEGRVTSIASGIVEPVRVRVVQAIEENAVTKAIADAAKRVADAIDQHFWTDTNGIHVTHATQEDWETSHSGPNLLLNSVGQLFRDGLNNLVAITTEQGARAISFFDGLGNDAANIIAYFGSSGARIGYTSGNRVEVTSDGVDAKSGSGNSYTRVDSTGFKAYVANKLRLALASTGLSIYDGSGTAASNVTALFTSTSARIGKSNHYAQMGVSGFTVADTDLPGTTNIAPVVNGAHQTFGSSTNASANIEGTSASGSAQIQLTAYRNGSQSTYGPHVVLNNNSSSNTLQLLTSTNGGDDKGIAIYATRTNIDTPVYVLDGNVTTTNDDVDYSTALSADTGGTGLYMTFDNSTYSGTLGNLRSYGRSGADRKRGIQIGGHNPDHTNWNYLYLLTDKDGNRVVQVSESKPWRDAINPSPLVTETPSAVSVATSSWSTLGSITVTQGIWVFSISTTFDSNSSGRRAVYFGTSSTGTSVTVGTMGGSIMAPAVGDKTKYSNCHIGQVSASTTYYCRAWQNSGSSLSCQCYLRAVRIV